MTARGRGGSVGFVVLTEAARLDVPEKSTVDVSLADLGISGEATVRDLWKKQDLGVVAGTFSQKILPHGAGLYQVTPLP